MLVTEQNGAQMWRTMLTENFHVEDQDKLNWVSQYAALHEIYESQLGVNAGNVLNNAPAAVGPIYTTPLNTTGMGNPYAPGVVPTTNFAQGQVPVGGTPGFYGQTVGSGDMPISTLPMALNVALLTVGLELVPVIPAKGPWHMLSYMDFPYAGGKLGRVNETSFDGKGEGNENKPIYVKVKGLTLAQIAELRAAKVAKGDEVEAGDLKGWFIGFGRMDGCPLVEVKESGDVSLREALAAAESLTIGEAEAIEVEAGTLEADFVQTSVDLADGFANFHVKASDKDNFRRTMTRAENETGTGNTIGLRLFSKWIQMGSYEVTGTVTRQQLQDLPLYGVDAVGKVMEAMQNEITQHINQRIVERAFALGVQNAVQQKAYQGVDLNLYMGKSASKNLADFGIKEFVDAHGVDQLADWGAVANAEVNTSAENLHTRQRRIMSRILAAVTVIQNVGRRGRPTWVLTNGQIAAALEDVSGYVVAPFANALSQDGSKDLYMGGSVAGLKIYVDPYMDWNDCRICVGRKGDANSPGLVFLPYILADQVQITAEGTMAPKMLLNSRFALAELGFYPETMYYTFAVFSDFGII
jgi:hypothetical protein